VGGWAGEGDGPEERRVDGRKAEGGRNRGRLEGRSGSGDAIAEEKEEYCIHICTSGRAARRAHHRPPGRAGIGQRRSRSPRRSGGRPGYRLGDNEKIWDIIADFSRHVTAATRPPGVVVGLCRCTGTVDSGN